MENAAETTTTALQIAQKYLPSKIAEQIKNLDEKATDMAALMQSAKSLNPMTLATAQAVIIAQIREALTPEILKYIKSLANTPIGFQTDRKPGKRYNKRTGQTEEVLDYTDDEYRDFAIACYAAGARVFGNEANIIKGKMLLVKNFYSRLLDQSLGKQNWSTRYTGMQQGDKGARVTGAVWWKDSEGEHRDEKYFADVAGDKETSSVSMYIGKWEKLAARYIYEQSTGIKAPVDAEEAIDVTAQEVKAEKDFADGEAIITDAEAKTLCNMAASKGITLEELGYLVYNRFGYQSNKDVKKCDLGAIMAEINRAQPGKIIPERER